MASSSEYEARLYYRSEHKCGHLSFVKTRIKKLVTFWQEKFKGEPLTNVAWNEIDNEIDKKIGACQKGRTYSKKDIYKIFTIYIGLFGVTFLLVGISWILNIPLPHLAEQFPSITIIIGYLYFMPLVFIYYDKPVVNTYLYSKIHEITYLLKNKSFLRWLVIIVSIKLFAILVSINNSEVFNDKEKFINASSIFAIIFLGPICEEVLFRRFIIEIYEPVK